MSEPRIPPRPTADWDDAADAALSVLTAHGPGGSAPVKLTPETRPQSNILGIYAWHPQLMAGWLPYSNHLRNSTLGDRIREIAIIRTTWLGHGEYEWAQHVRMSLAANWLTQDEIDGLSEGPTAAVWSPEDATLVTAIDEMVKDKAVSDATWAALEGQLNRQQLIDLLFTVGTYDFHCMVFRVMGLELEEGMPRFPEAHAALV